MGSRMLCLSEAVREITNATKPQSWHAGRSPVPYFFVVGAGISHPSIPLANGIEELCRVAIQERGETVPTITGGQLERYAGLFQAAFQQAEHRRAFLHHHIKSARVSAANFRLAHIVSSGKVANLVVTTNFDELLTKALRLFGRDVIVCDHPKTTRRIDPEREDVQVVHVHGTHWFYDCCNLMDEIEERASSDVEDNSNMRDLLDRILSNRSPLVIGYSGWEKDVVMGAIRRRLRQQALSYNLYWFCFQRSDIEALPTWLRDHGSVRFVVPDAQLADRADGRSKTDVSGKGTHAVSVMAGTSGGSSSTGATLPARQVFDALIRSLNLEEPALTKDPLSYFEKFLTDIIALDDSDEDDIYLIRSAIRRVKDGAEMVTREMKRRSEKAQEAAALLSQVNGMVRSAAYLDAAKLAKIIDFECLTGESQCLDMDNALEAIHQGMADLFPEIRLDASEMRLRLCERAQSVGCEIQHWKVSWAKAFNGKGAALSALGRPDESITAYEETLMRFGEAPEYPLKERVAQAFFEKGYVLSENGRRAEGVAAFEEVARRFGDAVEIGLKKWVARALIHKGVVISRNGQCSTAILSFDEVVKRFSGVDDISLKEQVVHAVLQRGLSLAMERKLAEAIVAFDEVVSRCRESTSIAMKERCAQALLGRGIALNLDARWAETYFPHVPKLISRNLQVRFD